MAERISGSLTSADDTKINFENSKHKEFNVRGNLSSISESVNTELNEFHKVCTKVEPSKNVFETNLFAKDTVIDKNNGVIA
jgi:hypothetical protein